MPPNEIACVALPNRPFKTGWVDRWPSLVRLSNALPLAWASPGFKQTSKHAGFTARLLWSIWGATGHVARPTRPLPALKHACPNAPGRQLAFSGRSEQRSDSRLSNALADQGFKQATPDTSSLPDGSTAAAFTVHMLFPLLTKRLRRKASSRPTRQQTEHLVQTDPLF